MTRTIFYAVLVVVASLIDDSQEPKSTRIFETVDAVPEGISGKLLFSYQDYSWDGGAHHYYRVDLPSLTVTPIQNFREQYDTFHTMMLGSPNGDLFAYKNDFSGAYSDVIKIFDYDGNFRYRAPLAIGKSRMKCFSPDGTYLYFSNDYSGIVRTNVYAQASEYVVTSQNFTYDFSPALSPDNSIFCWAHIERERLADICLTRTSSLPITFDERLCEKLFSVRTFEVVEDPCIRFLDQKNIVFKFTSCDEENNRKVFARIYLLNLETRELKIVFSTERKVSWLDCANGRYISFKSEDVLNDFRIIDLATGIVYVEDSFSYYDRQFPWSPDGRHYLRGMWLGSLQAVSLDERKAYKLLDFGSGTNEIGTWVK